MNHPTEPPIPAFPDPASEREWLTQEEARRCELLPLGSAPNDLRMRPHRAIAHALREPLDASLPLDFARQMAAQVNVASTPAMDVRFERSLTLALGTAMAVAATVVATLYGATWLTTAAPLLSVMHGVNAVNGPWLPALVACLGVSWLLGKLPRHAHTLTSI